MTTSEADQTLLDAAKRNVALESLSLAKPPTPADLELAAEDAFKAFRLAATPSNTWTAYAKALVALKKNITPLGFSACSLDDNTVTGIDANYRSVWARDGAITVWSTASTTPS